ncbi:MAG: hypothetical protein AAGD07_14545 [Planctomycetota bacterium]
MNENRTNDEANTNPSRLGSGEKACWFTLCVILAMTPIALVGDAVRQLWAANEAEEIRQRLINEGVPLSSAALAVKAASNASDTGGATLQRIADAIYRYRLPTGFLVDEFSNEGAFVPPQEEWMVGKLLAERASDASAIVSAMESLATDQPIQQPLLFEGMQTLLPETQSSREHIRFLRRQAQLAYHQGDFERVVTLIELMQTLADVGDWQVFLVSELVWTAKQEAIATSICECMEHDVFTDGQLERLKAIVARTINYSDRWKIAMGSELAMAAAQLGIVEEGGAVHWALGVLAGHQTGSSRLYALRGFDATIQEGERLGGLAWDPDQWPEPFDESSRTVSLVSFPLADDAILMQQMHPGVKRLAQVYHRLETHRRVARLAIGLRQYEHANDSWPGDLSVLSKFGVVDSDSRYPSGKWIGYANRDEGPAYLWIDLDEPGERRSPFTNEEVEDKGNRWQYELNP